MKKNILIIGKKSFIGANLFKFLKNKLPVKIIDYENFKKKNTFYLSKFQFLINCTSNKSYINKKYKIKYDHDRFIVEKIKNTNINFFFLSTRKVYKAGYNLNEKSLIKPLSHYAKNKYISEKKLKKILGNKLIILRISNVIGYRIKTNRSLHNTFVDNFFSNIDKGYILSPNNDYKDFISINDLCKAIYLLIKKPVYGIYNLSIGRKIYLKSIVKWLNYYNSCSFLIKKNTKKDNNESFTLNNSKLIKKINMKIKISNLKKECKKLSKNYFNKRHAK